MVFVDWCTRRHGVRQLRTGWADGPAYVTQCQIQTGHTYTYNFTLTGHRGTLFWHAHISWLRSTVYGPLIIFPRRNESYPFEKPYKEVPIMFGNQPQAQYKQLVYNLLMHAIWLLISREFLLWCKTWHVLSWFSGEWWNADTEAVISQALQTGGAPNVSDAYTINGLPGPLYNCSHEGMISLCLWWHSYLPAWLSFKAFLKDIGTASSEIFISI